MRLKLVVVFSFLLACPVTLLADTYNYSFSSTGSDQTKFTFTTASLVTSDTVFTPTSCSYYDSTYGALTCVSVEADIFNAGGFYLTPSKTYANAEDIFPGFSLTKIGTQSNGLDTLIITDVSSAAATPEPSSILLLGTGLPLLAGIARRRLVRKADSVD